MALSQLQRPVLLSLLLGLALSPAALPRAATFTIKPTQVVLSAKTPSVLVTLHNTSSETLRFQLSLFGWAQRPNGEMELTPTEDLVWFPTLLQLAPGEERKVRVGSATSIASTEKTYRLFIEELPPMQTPQAGPSGTQVRILTRIGIPIFLQPAKLEAGGHIEALAIRHGQLSFQVKNVGNVHFVVQAVRISGFTAAEEQVFERQLDGWYVLAGGRRIYQLELPEGDCTRIQMLAVEVDTQHATFTSRFDLLSRACDN